MGYLICYSGIFFQPSPTDQCRGSRTSQPSPKEKEKTQISGWCQHAAKHIGTECPAANRTILPYLPSSHGKIMSWHSVPLTGHSPTSQEFFTSQIKGKLRSMTDHSFIFNDISKNNLTFILKISATLTGTQSVVGSPSLPVPVQREHGQMCSHTEAIPGHLFRGPGYRPAVELR